MTGPNMMRKLAKRASESGHAPTQERLANTLAFQGVGVGQPTARWNVTVPSAVQTSNGPQLVDYSALVVEGDGGEERGEPVS